MRKLLLFVMALFASFSSFAQSEGELAFKDVTILNGTTCRMFVKSFPQSIIDHVASGEKIVVRYTSDDESIVRTEGDRFVGAANGTTNVNMLISKAYPGTLDAFDPENVLFDQAFQVTVSDEDPIKVPSFDLSWGKAREEVIATQESFGHSRYTDEYFNMFPNVKENEPEIVAATEVFYNDNFEAPITIDQMTSESDQLLASTVVFNSWDRVVSGDSYMVNWIKNKGFEYVGSEGAYWYMNLMQGGVSTMASWCMIIIQSSPYIGLMFNYDDEGTQNGIEEATQDFADVDVQTYGTTIKLDASKYVGNKVVLSDAAGKCIASTTASVFGNEFNVPSHGLYIVKVDGYKAIKVLL